MINRESLRPPHSADAEVAVIGAMLLSGEIIDQVSAVLRAEHLYYPDLQAIYATMLRLHVAHKPVDVITVCEAGAHDMAYVHSLSMGCHSPANAMRHAEIVVEAWQARQLMRVGCDIADDAVHRIDPEVTTADRIDKAVTSLMAIGAEGAAELPRSAVQMVSTFLDRMQDRMDGKDDVTSTGLADLDEQTAGGIRPGELWVFGARPSMGKTALTLTVSGNIAERADEGALFLSQEDSEMTASSRFIARKGRISLSHIRTGKLSDEEWGRLSEAADAMSGMNLYFDDKSSLTLLDVRRRIQQVRRLMSLKVVVIDYLQLMQGDGATRNIELGKIANGLKAAAKDLGVGIILLSQMGREVERRTGPPQMSDLRDSGDIEGAADLIGLLHRPFMRNPTPENKHFAELHIVKQKNGPTGMVHLHFDGAYQRFSNWTGPAPSSAKGSASSAKGFS